MFARFIIIVLSLCVLIGLKEWVVDISGRLVSREDMKNKPSKSRNKLSKTALQKELFIKIKHFVATIPNIIVAKIPKILKDNVLAIASITYIIYIFSNSKIGLVNAIFFSIALIYLITLFSIALVRKRKGIDLAMGIILGFLFLLVVIGMPFTIGLSQPNTKFLTLALVMPIIIIPLFFLTFYTLNSLKKTALSLTIGMSFILLSYAEIFFLFGVYNIHHFTKINISFRNIFSLNHNTTDILYILEYGTQNVFQFPSIPSIYPAPVIEFLSVWLYNTLVITTLLASLSAIISEFRNKQKKGT